MMTNMTVIVVYTTVSYSSLPLVWYPVLHVHTDTVVLMKALAGVLMSMLDKGVRLHPDSYSVVISRANQVSSTLHSSMRQCMFFTQRL